MSILATAHMMVPSISVVTGKNGKSILAPSKIADSRSLSLTIVLGTGTALAVLFLVTTTEKKKRQLLKQTMIGRILDAWCGRLYMNGILLLSKAKTMFKSSTSQSATNTITETSSTTVLAPESLTTNITITSLFVYPVKSLKAVPVQSIRLEERGLMNDRKYMIVSPLPVPLWGSFGPNDPTYRFLTQRQCPILTQISVHINETTNQLEFSCSNSGSYPELDLMKTVVVQIMATPPNKTKYLAKIWDDVVSVQDMGDEIAEYLTGIVKGDPEVPSEIKQAGVRLVVQCTDDARVADDDYVPGSVRNVLTGNGPNVALSDGFPILVTSVDSLCDLNQRLEAKGKSSLSMSNFRPNIVLRGLATPFREDEIKVLRIIGKKDTTILHFVKGCPRCKQSCTDQETGIVSDEPLATLREFRSMNQMNCEDLYFGQNAVVGMGCTSHTISVGDRVEVVQWGSPVWDG